jgi:hypothetical protein
MKLTVHKPLLVEKIPHLSHQQDVHFTTIM